VSTTELPEVSKRVAAGLDDMTTDPNFLSSHLRWELRQVMSRLRPEDLSVVEIAALLEILAPSHFRVVGGPAGRPRLCLLGVRGEDAPPDLA
jgi:hypothetical protein